MTNLPEILSTIASLQTQVSSMVEELKKLNNKR
jgi:hypothetical protein